jgi:hypothetical protein
MTPFAVFAVVAVVLGPPATPAPTPDAWRAVAEAGRHPIELKDGQLSGEGFEFLMKALAGTQFVVLGEEHNTAEIPPFTAALFRALHERFGYRYFAEEQDPLVMERASAPPLRGDRAALEDLARAHPYAFTFVSDEELAMLAEIGRISTGRSRLLWGCEQAFGATLYLSELEQLAPTPGIRGLVSSLLERAQEAEKPVRDLDARHFMSRDREKSALLKALRDAWAPREGARAADLLDTLLKSDEIYGYYARAKAGEVVGLLNNTVREADMKERFRREFRLAEARDGAAPKVLLKYGHVHAQRGRSPMNAFNLGNFVSDVATFFGTRSFHVAIVHYDSPASLKGHGGEAAFLATLAPAEGWELLDLRPLQPWLHSRKMDAGLPEASRAALRDFLFGFDAILFMPHGRRGTYSVTGAKY